MRFQYFALASASGALGDLPVHCLRHQIIGDWEFTLSPPSDRRSSCGHQRPDDQKQEPALRSLDAYGGAQSTLAVNLGLPNQASTSRDSMGTFTMIYDEGFEVAVENKVFFAFSRYDLDASGNNVTHCDETLTGWYHDQEGGKYGCYYGRKAGAQTSEDAGLDGGEKTSEEAAVSLASQVTSYTLGAAASGSSEDAESSDDSESEPEVSAPRAKLQAEEDSLDWRSPSLPSVADDNTDLSALSEERTVTVRKHRHEDTVSTILDASESSTGSKAAFSDDAEQAQFRTQREQDSQRSMESRLSEIADSYATAEVVAPRSDEPLTEDFHQSVVDHINSRHHDLSDSLEAKESEFAGVSEPSRSEESEDSAATAWRSPTWTSTNEFRGTLLQKKTKTVRKKTWTATVYPQFINKTREEINRMAGIKRSVSLAEAHLNAHRNRPASSHATVSSTGAKKKESPSFLQYHSKASTHRNNKDAKMHLPRSVDWAEQGYVDQVINQGDCGSCFTVATVRMLSARNRVKNNDKTLDPFSIAFPLHCGEYNQGCDGGYAFLQSKWSEDVGLIPAKCFPYTVDSAGACSAFASDSSRSDDGCVAPSGRASYKAHNHRYIGGFYGGSDEEDIMEELVHNGPLVVSFEPNDDFMYYSKGIYNSSPNQIHQEWERVDHAVLLVGYGEEEDQGRTHKFWKVQNSWGPEWGESGFFRITRGDNDSGIESISVAADVVETDGSRVRDFIQYVKSPS